MTDDLSVFIMFGARRAIATGLTHIDQQVSSIERAVAENPGLAFDLARTLVESVCRAVLRDRAVSYSDNDDLPKLFRAVCQHVPFLPSATSNDAQVRQSLLQTVNGLHTAIQGICELRNRCGFASHGSADSRPVMETVQAILAAQAADTIVGFLYRLHSQDRTAALAESPSHRDNQAFNEWVDEIHGIFRVFDVEFRPSEVLFEMEPETYRVYLTEFETPADGIESEPEVGQMPEKIKCPTQ